jgi:uncharacterized repeat protein (TIGR03803 family)
MRISGWLFLHRGVLAGLVASWGFALSAYGQTFTTLAQFNGVNGAYPTSIVQATDGNFYGATTFGGEYGRGNLFKVTPDGAVTSLYSFCPQENDCTDGFIVESGPIFGIDGNLYGVTTGGGVTGLGTVYRTTLAGQLTSLYSFGSCSSSVCPWDPQGLMQAANGNLFGVTVFGNLESGGDGGSIFESTTEGVVKILYNFCSQQDCVDGFDPLFAPVQGSNGYLYGTTRLGGNRNLGTLYAVSPSGSYGVLYNFCSVRGCSDGATPEGKLAIDSAGNLYGTTLIAGELYGAVFKFTPPDKYVVLHRFDYTDGAYPTGVTLANDGNLYGMTTAGGSAGKGNIFEISPGGAFSSLYSFCGSASCASASAAGLIQGTDGILYGTGGGGNTLDCESGCGTVFSFNNNLSPLVETVPTMGKVGARVIILGNGLTGSSSVTFNGVAAAFTVESNTYVTATVPAGATTGTVSVVTPTGTLDSNPEFVVTK